MTTKVHSLTLITKISADGTNGWAVCFRSEVHEIEGELILRRWGEFHQPYLTLKEAVKLAFSKNKQVVMRVSEDSWKVTPVNDDYDIVQALLTQ